MAINVPPQLAGMMGQPDMLQVDKFFDAGIKRHEFNADAAPNLCSDWLAGWLIGKRKLVVLAQWGRGREHQVTSK